jgi:mono/diheme cytochrome c family protein
MIDEIKQKIHQKYERMLIHGERFWPDSIFKDAIMALAIFAILILLATFIGVSPEPKADPSDTAYVPRPEWYFLFLFKFLALYGQIPVLGKIEWIATTIIPGAAVLLLVVLPFLERNPNRYYGKRILPLSVMGVSIVTIISLTLMANNPTTSDQPGIFLGGILQTLAGLALPGLALLLLFGMAYFIKNSGKAMIWTAGTASTLILVLTVAVLFIAPAAKQEEVEVATNIPDQVVAGQDLYSINCVECHGDDGSVTTIEGVEGLEGKVISAINSTDILYTLDDASLADIIAHGRPEAGMNPFGKAYGGELSSSEVSYIVTFMRYAWDDRFEMPPIKPLYPPLAEGEIPSYEVHIQPIVKRYCLSCHRAGKDNNNYLMDTYEDILNSGDNAPVLTAGDPESILLKVIQGTPIPDPDDPSKELIRTMPPNRALKPDVVDVFVRWVMAGMPDSAADAAAIPTPTPVPTPEATATP